ncbi:MAG: L-2-amino-thiazoline-4-carboxylic acid hydrolase [Saprospiraceae bacterium]
MKAIQKHYPGDADHIIASTDLQYGKISIDTRFARTSKNPVDKRLDFCAYFLALIKTLDIRGESFDTIRKICLEVVTDFVKRIPAMLINTSFARVFLKVFNKRVSSNSNPEGFIANIITDKVETYGFGYGIDIIECGICKLFAKHQYQKFSPILCEVDEITSGLAGLKLIRTGTIALGAKKCDFRFKKM